MASSPLVSRYMVFFGMAAGAILAPMLSASDLHINFMLDAAPLVDDELSAALLPAAFVVAPPLAPDCAVAIFDEPCAIFDAPPPIAALSIA